jgi:hypothetical protein
MIKKCKGLYRKDFWFLLTIDTSFAEEGAWMLWLWSVMHFTSKGHGGLLKNWSALIGLSDAFWVCAFVVCHGCGLTGRHLPRARQFRKIFTPPVSSPPVSYHFRVAMIHSILTWILFWRGLTGNNKSNIIMCINIITIFIVSSVQPPLLTRAGN